MPSEDSDDVIEIVVRPASAVAERAVVLATLVRRGVLDLLTSDDAEDTETDRFELSTWAALHLPDALEPDEKRLLQRAAGRLDDEAMATCLNAGEALAALQWCLSPNHPPLPDPVHAAAMPDVLAALPQPWDEVTPFVERAALRPENEIAFERERSEIWQWRASVEPSATDDPDLRAAIAGVAQESAAIGLIDAVDGDLAVDSTPFGALSEEARATALVVSSARLHALNWVCGFGTSWRDTPLDIA